MRQSDFCDQVQRGVIIQVAVADDPAVPVQRVLTGAHVGNNEDLGNGILQSSHGVLDDSVLSVGARRLFILGLGHAKQKNRGNT